MSRNDSYLSSGIYSSTSRKMTERKKREAEQRGEQRVKIEPSHELIANEIKKIRDEIKLECISAIDSKMTAKEVQILREGAKWADSKIVSLQIRLNNILRQGVDNA